MCTQVRERVVATVVHDLKTATFSQRHHFGRGFLSATRRTVLTRTVDRRLRLELLLNVVHGYRSRICVVRTLRRRFCIQTASNIDVLELRRQICLAVNRCPIQLRKWDLDEHP